MRILYLLFFLYLTPFLKGQPLLFPIVENGLNGFIDSTGKVVIMPKFKTIKPFAEGLAAAREPEGDYGFIDSTGVCNADSEAILAIWNADIQGQQGN